MDPNNNGNESVHKNVNKKKPSKSETCFSTKDKIMMVIMTLLASALIAIDVRSQEINHNIDQFTSWKQSLEKEIRDTVFRIEEGKNTGPSGTATLPYKRELLNEIERRLQEQRDRWDYFSISNVGRFLWYGFGSSGFLLLLLYMQLFAPTENKGNDQAASDGEHRG